MKLKLILFLNLVFSGFLFAQQDQLTFNHQNIDFSAGPRTTINPMSIKLWDNYNNGGPTAYGTVMEFYGLSSHQTGQLYFGGWDNSKIRYREAFYAESNWSDWKTLLDSKNDVESSGRLMVSGVGNHYITGGNVGIGTTNPAAKISFNNLNDGSDAADGITWYNGSPQSYGIYRTPGPWVAPAFQQLKLSWDTGIVLDPGSSYQNSYVDIKGSGLWVSSGNVGIGTASPNAMLDVNGAAIINGPAGITLTLKKMSSNVPGIAFQGANQVVVLEGGDDYFTAYTGGSRRFSILSNGNVGIGTINPQERLSVAGTIGAREIKVSTNTGADFVFEPDYELPTLNELERFVKTNKHLPEIPTAKQMVKEGVNLGELNIKLLQKVEELTLHLIEKDKELQNSNKRLLSVEAKQKEMEALLKKLTANR